jgi:three-Cys-motif partner protein
VDGFAGTGSRTVRALERQARLPFQAHEVRTFFDGSARLALQSEAEFHAYIFIEKSGRKASALESLKREFPNKAGRIRIEKRDANEFLLEFFAKSWEEHRAVLFLDPFGMQVHWQTLEAAARTKAVDLWYLFPLGVAVVRLMKRDGSISEKWRSKLDSIFGTKDWFAHFYRRQSDLGLFGEQQTVTREGSFDEIKDYFLARLRSLFPGVAKNPLLLTNSRGRPLYLLCFACANPNAVEPALQIAEHVLGKEN